MIEIKNLNPNPHYSCACGSWLKHWEKFSMNKEPACAVANCTSCASVGTHVQLADSTDENWYVLPLCNEHAASTENLVVWKRYKLVPANTDLTCDRW